MCMWGLHKRMKTQRREQNRKLLYRADTEMINLCEGLTSKRFELWAVNGEEVTER